VAHGAKVKSNLHVVRVDFAPLEVSGGEIASGLGFEHAAHFTLFLKQHTSQTPLAFRCSVRPE
jgi:AraC-like DNA-binding protein